MRFRIEGKDPKAGKQFIEKDFEDRKAAWIYQKEKCSTWKKPKVKELKK